MELSEEKRTVKNNIKALLLHIIILVVSFIILTIFVTTGPTLGKYTTNIVTRSILAIVLILFYIISGTFLDLNKNRIYDFFTGSIVGIIGIGIWLYTFSITGKNLIYIPKELSEYWILMNLYNVPFTMVYFLLEISQTPLLLLFTNLLPSFLMGCGLKLKRKLRHGK